MMPFWIIVTAMSLLAIFALIPALLGKRAVQLETVRERNIAIAKERKAEIESLFENEELTEAEYKATKQDLEASLAADLEEPSLLKTDGEQSSPITAIIVALAIPLCAISVYFATGHGGPPDEAEYKIAASPSGSGAPSLEDLISGLESKVAENPDDARGHFLLAETYKRLGRYADAAKSYKKLRTLQEDNPETLSSYADALVMSNNGAFTAETEALLDQSLKLDPKHINSLWLGGMAKEELGKPMQAIAYWKRLMPLLSSSPQDQSELQAMIDALGLATQGTPASNAPSISSTPAKQESNTQAKDASAGLSVTISLDPSLLNSTKASDIVFVFARAKTGPPMPLAAVRKTVADLPFSVHLNDSMAMIPNMSLSKFPEVVVSARISKSGQPTAQAGDLQSESITTPNSREDTINLTISKLLP